MDAGQLTAAVPADRAAILLIAATDGAQLQRLADRSVDMDAVVADLLRLLGGHPEGE